MSIVNDNMSDTPETDAEHKQFAMGGFTLDFCRKLERERDDLQKAVNGLCEHFKVSPSNTTLLAVEVLRIHRERDEAITRRMETIMQCELYEQERDEALRELAEAREDAINYYAKIGDLESELRGIGILCEKANELIARWDQPSWKDTAPTAGFIYALRDAVESYEKKKL